MFCPSCEGEFRDGVTLCPDCGVELVVELEAPPHDTRPLEVVYSTDEPQLLPVVRSLLDETDIPYAIRGEETLGMFPGAGIGLAIDSKAHAAQVMVPADRAEEARELLSELDS